jgi:DNA-binding CsgD family transcriptional regulator
LARAEMANLPLWRLRALHELGTIELFEQAGVDRLGQARRTAAELGALSTAAVLDIQLAAAYLFRFDPDAGQRHAAAALAAAERLRLTQLRATAQVFLAELSGLRRDGEAMERHNSLALAAAPGDIEIEGSVWGGRGIAALLGGDEAGACRALQRAVECLAPLPNSGPGIYLGLWPLLLAVQADPHAADAIASARRTGMTVNRANRGMLLYAEAVLGGRKPGNGPAAELADRGAAELAHFPVWSDLARMLAARAALADGWGEPRRWLTSAAESFGRSGVEPLVQRCHAILAEPVPDRLSSLGVTPRESQVLDLVSAGLSNRDIAARLYVSHRTVEKHIESLLRKTGARSRIQLATVRAGALRPGSR